MLAPERVIMTDNIKELAQKTLKRATDLSELWTGTTVGSVIDYRADHVRSLLLSKDMNLVSIAILELVQSCENAERDSDEY